MSFEHTGETVLPYRYESMVDGIVWGIELVALRLVGHSGEFDGAWRQRGGSVCILF